MGLPEPEEEVRTDQQAVGVQLQALNAMDFKRNKESSFSNTITLVSNLIN